MFLFFKISAKHKSTVYSEIRTVLFVHLPFIQSLFHQQTFDCIKTVLAVGRFNHSHRYNCKSGRLRIFRATHKNFACAKNLIKILYPLPLRSFISMHTSEFSIKNYNYLLANSNVIRIQLILIMFQARLL